MCGGRVESRGQEVDPLPEVHKVEGARLFVPDARDPSRTMDAAVVSFVPKDPNLLGSFPRVDPVPR